MTISVKWMNGNTVHHVLGDFHPKNPLLNILPPSDGDTRNIIIFVEFSPYRTAAVAL